MCIFEWEIISLGKSCFSEYFIYTQKKGFICLLNILLYANKKGWLKNHPLFFFLFPYINITAIIKKPQATWSAMYIIAENFNLFIAQSSLLNCSVYLIDSHVKLIDAYPNTQRYYVHQADIIDAIGIIIYTIIKKGEYCYEWKTRS